MSGSGVLSGLFSSASVPPLMPWSWWIFLAANAVLVFFFDTDCYSAIFRFLCDLVSQIVDRRSDPVFDMYGVYLYCGRVGCGKTISMVRRAQRIKKKYPNVKIYANFHTDVADGFITHWRDIYDIQNFDKNGVNQGVLFLFDEIHLTFSSRAWKDAPANLLEYISLQRHHHKCIMGASQVYTRVDKVIREQADWIIECRTYFGKRLVRNTTYTQEEYQVNGELRNSGIRKRHHVSNFCYYASDALRALYNTDEIVTNIDIGVDRKDMHDMALSS